MEIPRTQAQVGVLGPVDPSALSVTRHRGLRSEEKPSISNTSHLNLNTNAEPDYRPNTKAREFPDRAYCNFSMEKLGRDSFRLDHGDPKRSNR